MLHRNFLPARRCPRCAIVAQVERYTYASTRPDSVGTARRLPVILSQNANFMSRTISRQPRPRPPVHNTQFRSQRSPQAALKSPRTSVERILAFKRSSRNSQANPAPACRSSPEPGRPPPTI